MNNLKDVSLEPFIVEAHQAYNLPQNPAPTAGGMEQVHIKLDLLLFTNVLYTSIIFHA